MLEECDAEYDDDDLWPIDDIGTVNLEPLTPEQRAFYEEFILKDHSAAFIEAAGKRLAELFAKAIRHRNDLVTQFLNASPPLSVIESAQRFGLPAYLLADDNGRTLSEAAIHHELFLMRLGIR